MEEDVGIFDPEGLVAYAAYFRDALIGGVGIDFEVLESKVENAFLVLQYSIGASILEGRIKLRLLQSDLSAEIYSMLKLAYHFDPSRKIATGTRNTLTVRNSAKIAEIATGADGVEDASVDQPAEPSETVAESSNATARAAKKRRVGGVNIFPGMRKVNSTWIISLYICILQCIQVPPMRMVR